MGKKNKPKPEGPVYVDMREQLFESLTVRQIIDVANLALNRLTMRDMAEVFHDAGVRMEFRMSDAEPAPEEAQE